MTAGPSVLGVRSVCERTTLCRKPVSAPRRMNPRVSRTLPQRAGARRGFAATPRTNAACLFRRKRLWSLIFKLCSFLIRVCSVFPCCHCLLCLFEGREGVLFIQGGGRGWGGGGVISVEHRVAFLMDFPSVLKLFGLLWPASSSHGQ